MEKMDEMEKSGIVEKAERMERMEKDEQPRLISKHRKEHKGCLRFCTTPANSEEQSQSFSRKGYDFGVITDRILKCAVTVHKELGPYFMEITYQRALALELRAEGLDFARECWVDIYYKGQRVHKRRVDFLVEDVLVELKAKAVLEDKDYIQTLAYLKATGYTTGLLINFGGKKVKVRRLQWTPK